MQNIKAILLLSCLLILGPSGRVEVNGLNIQGATHCAEVIIEGLVLISTKAIPLLKQSAKCIGFVPQKTTDLDGEYLLLLTYKFLQQFTGNKKCMDNVVDEAHGVLKPFIKNFYDRQCVPQNF